MEALALGEAHLAPNDPLRISLLYAAAHNHFVMSDYATVEELAKRGVAIAERVLPEDDPELARGLQYVGMSIIYQERFAEGKPYLERAGTEFVLVMQITGTEQQITGTPSMWGGGFYGPGWGGWGGWGWGGGTDIRTDTLVGVETLLFDLKADKLVWAGQSQTMNPSKAESFARELIRAVGDELRKDGLIPEQK